MYQGTLIISYYCGLSSNKHILHKLMFAVSEEWVKPQGMQA